MKISNLFLIKTKQEAQWACIAHLVFNIQMYISLYQTITNGCYMLNMNAFRPVIHGKKDVLCVLLYKPI